MSIRSFDRLASCYRLLEFLAFGPDLERARYCHLDRLRDCRAILVLGEGDGRCLVQLVRRAPLAQVTCVDFSPAMLARAAARLSAADRVRVRFVQADLLQESVPAGPHDAVLTLFFLDCFTAAQAAGLIGKITATLHPGAIWLWADFRLPERGLARWRAAAWVKILYFFFRWQTGLPARELPPAEELIQRAGLLPIVHRDYQRGLVRSAVFSQPGSRTCSS
jgi:ubiquinone/menaquinone biosynthesis C-methylase UbiE